MLCLGATKAKAQVNAQLFYDFGSDREFVTLTLEMFKQDKWGNTYFFIDHDFNYDKLGGGKNVAPGGTYLEIVCHQRPLAAGGVQRRYHTLLPYQPRHARRCRLLLP